MKEWKKKERGKKMKKSTKVTTVAVLAVFVFMAVMAACGGGEGNLKGTVWVGKAGVWEYDQFFSTLQKTYKRPEFEFHKMEFDAKENKVTISKDARSYEVRDREYEVEKGKELVIYREDKKKTKEYLKQFPMDSVRVLIRGTIDKDEITINGETYDRKTKEEADELFKRLADDYNKKVDAYNEIAEYAESLWK